MSEFAIHSLDTVPLESRELLKRTKNQLGFIPNLLAVMSESSTTLEAYLELTSLFDKTAFTAIERQLVLLSISRHRNCCYCLAAHGTVAKMQKIPHQIIDAVFYKQPLTDLAHLRDFTPSKPLIYCYRSFPIRKSPLKSRVFF